MPKAPQFPAVTVTKTPQLPAVTVPKTPQLPAVTVPKAPQFPAVTVTKTQPQRCLGRIAKKNKTGLFGDGKHTFYFEFRCKETLSSSKEKLCDTCQWRKGPEAEPYEDQKLHGLVTKPLPPKSHMFGSRWYQSKVRKWGEPVEEVMVRAKKAAAAAVPASPTEQPKAKAKRAPKKVTAAAPDAPAPPALLQAVEAPPEPLRGVEVVRVQVRPLEHDGKKYFLDSKKNKLYATTGSGGNQVGPYVGRWHPTEQQIHKDIPDSDTE